MAMTAADLVVKMSADTRGAEAGIQRVSRGISGFAKSAAAVGTGILGAAAFAPIIHGFSGAITGAIGFGKEMANVNSILQTSSGTITKAGDDLLEMALRTAQAPTVLAAGLYQIVSSGYSNLADAEKILEIAANGATAGLTTTDVSARAVVGTMNAYGLGVEDAQRVSDVFFQTVNDGVLTYDQLANNLGKTTALAAGLNIPIEQLGAAYAQMTRNNVDAAQSETRIAALFTSALNPTQALTDAVHAHGYESAEALIRAKGLPGYLELLNETAGGSQTTMQELVGTQEAANAAMILGQKHGKAYNEILNHMAHASDGAGATQKALNKQMESSAYAIQKAKVALQVLATAGFGIVAPLVTKLATGLSSFVIKDLIPFTKIIGRATSANFTFGRGFDKLLKGIPQPLRRTVHALASFTDALSDMWRHGFSRNEITQAFHAVQALGEEFGQAVHWTVNAIVDAAVSLGSLLIEGVKAAPGFIFDWVRGKLFGQNTGVSQDPASPMYNMKGKPIDAGVWDVAVALGKVVVNGIADLAGWVHDKLVGLITGGGGSVSQDPASPMYGQGGKSIDLGAWTLNVAAPAVVSAVGDLGSWLNRFLFNETNNQQVGPVAWSLNLALPTVNLPESFKTGAQKGEWLKAKIGAISVDDFTNWKLIIGVPATLILGPEIIFEDLIVNRLTGLNPIKLVTWTLTVGAPTAVSFGLGVLFGTLPNAIQEKLTNVKATLPLWTLAVPLPSLTMPTTEQIGLAVAGKLQGLGDINLTWLNVFDLAMGLPGISLAFDLSDLIAAVKDKIKGLGGISFDLPNPLNVNIPNPFHDTPSPGTGQGEAKAGGGGGFFQPTTLVPPKIPAPDTTAFDTGMSAIVDSLKQNLTDATYTATIDANNQPATQKVAASGLLGSAWQRTTFTSTFDIDNGPAAVAYTNAFGWGATWAAQTFTARFAIDTSGLWNALAVAQTVAANISAIMPHSPAKKGPLSKPISFGFIADAARRDLAGLGNQISGYLGVGGNRRPLAYAGVHAGPRHYTFHIHESKDAGATGRAVVKELRAAGF